MKKPRFALVQYRTINIKTTSRKGLELMQKACLEKENTRTAWVQHPAEGSTPPHFHFVASFQKPVRLREALEELARMDPHAYIKPCRNFRASVRYLAHLDNPEKVQIDPASIVVAGDWEGVGMQSLLERKGAACNFTQVLDCLREYVASDEFDGNFVPVRFAVWLDVHGYSAKKAFLLVRVMGLDWSSLLMEVQP